MRPPDTYDLLRAANAAALDRLENLSPADKVAEICRQMSLVMTFDYSSDTWILHVARDSDLSDDALNYSDDLPDGVRSFDDLRRYLERSEWNEVLFRIGQDFDGFHGPHAVDLD
ncbi:hypothetical protein J2735_000557 [Agrobacterium tumefaciens]|nr:hypothetical protein [Agrobacterium tumefaciens]